ncbi:Aste57867_15869 [Aphanomyces stellatus]|uniref:Aste57867_15869 protein n=1 Tax=Aphanomyces stellatus TaxID=120398 RepID=A0A485L607_9STRA|nr:hypothetical protein As57867_015813 [Aphanomyces stellatus]VFT92656.1 Aste57867_15869 [Aphanomyces stellatus]
MSPPPMIESIRVEFNASFRSTGMGLRLYKATENGIGALLVCTVFTTPEPVRALPPCRYQLDAVGDTVVRHMKFTEIVSLVSKHSEYPVDVSFVRTPDAFDLHFPSPNEKLNLKINERKDGLARCEIIGYIPPYRCTGTIPSTLCGTHCIRAVNGVDLSQAHETSKVVDAIKHATFPLVISVDIVQTAESTVAQNNEVALTRRVTADAANKRLAPLSALSIANMKRLRGPPATIVLDDTDDEEESSEVASYNPTTSPQALRGLSPLTVDKAVRTPYGIGSILQVIRPVTASATVRLLHYKVQLPYGVGYFQPSALECIDDKTQFTYYKQKTKGWVVLTYGDTARLHGKRLLNDSVLEFYLSYLMDTMTLRDKAYICSSFLFGQYLDNKKLGGKAGGKGKGVEKAYESVCRWTKSVDIFDVKYLVIPINEDGHWSVVIVCNLYRFARVDRCRCNLHCEVPKPVKEKPAVAKTTTKRPRPKAANDGKTSKRTKKSSPKTTPAQENEKINVIDEASSPVLPTQENSEIASSQPKDLSTADEKRLATSDDTMCNAAPCRESDKTIDPDANVDCKMDDDVLPMQEETATTVEIIPEEPTTGVGELTEWPLNVTSSYSIPEDENRLPTEEASFSAVNPEAGSLDKNDPCAVDKVESATNNPFIAPVEMPIDNTIPSDELPKKKGPTDPIFCSVCLLEQDRVEGENHRPCILVLDSLKAHRTVRISNFLREYLQMEWNARKAESCGPMSFTLNNLPAFGCPDIPRQTNYTDCGVFVLHYVEKFLTRPPLISTAFVASRATDSQGILSTQWFPQSDIAAKRIYIRQLIEQLSAKAKRGDSHSCKKESSVSGV